MTGFVLFTFEYSESYGSYIVVAQSQGIERWFSVREDEEKEAFIEDFRDLLDEYILAYDHGVSTMEDANNFIDMVMFDTMQDLEHYLIEEL